MVVPAIGPATIKFPRGGELREIYHVHSVVVRAAVYRSGIRQSLRENPCSIHWAFLILIDCLFLSMAVLEIFRCGQTRL